MLTLFTLPKPFDGPIDILQRNAIASWTRLRPECEIILIGNEKGTADAAREFGVIHIDHIDRNEHGTPLLNSVFTPAEQAASHPFVCYVNTDIILMSDFMAVMQKFAANCQQKFLLVGMRWNLDLTELLDFNDPEWESKLRLYLKEHGSLHNIAGLDYFAYPKGLFGPIPPFAIGRCVWDNWLLWKALDRGSAVVDLSQCVTIIHQNHDYAHIVDMPDLPGRERLFQCPERERNIELAGGLGHVRDLSAATHFLHPEKGVVPVKRM